MFFNTEYLLSGDLEQKNHRLDELWSLAGRLEKSEDNISNLRQDILKSHDFLDKHVRDLERRCSPEFSASEFSVT